MRTKIFSKFLDIGILCALTFIIIGTLLNRGVVAGNSMLPTLTDGQQFLYTRVTDTPRRFKISLVELGGVQSIKRVLGVPGDVLLVDKTSEVVMVNNNVIPGKTVSFQEKYVVLTLGVDEYFVIGDNTEFSYDSIEYGTVGEEQFLGTFICNLN